MTRIVSYATLGAIGGLLFPLVGGWFSHYLGNLALFYAFLLGGMSALIGYLLSWCWSAPYSRALIYSIVTSGYYGFWLVNYSSLSGNRLWITLLTVFLFALAFGLSFLVETTIGPGWQTIFVICLFVLVLFANWTIVKLIPVSRILRTANTGFPSTSLEVSDVIYPLSVPLEEGAQRYAFLLEELDTQKSAVVIVLDAMRRDYLNNTINGMSITPTMNRVVENGGITGNYFVQGTWTRPSTASLFTGQYVRDHGICVPKGSDYGQQLPDEYQTLAERLDREGFLTVGSVFVGHLSNQVNFDQGFDVWYSPPENFRNDHLGFQSALLTIFRRNPQKLFLYVHMVGPHTPYALGLQNKSFWENTSYYRDGNVVLPDWRFPHPGTLKSSDINELALKKEQARISVREIKLLRYLYLSQLNFFDRQHLRRILATTKSFGIKKDSFMAITADHGEELFDTARTGTAQFGHIGNLSQSVVNPPLIIRPPNFYQSRKARQSNPLEHEVIESLDLGSTILDYARASRREYKGKSFLPLLRGKTVSGRFDDALIQRCPHYEDKSRLAEMSRQELQKDLHVSTSAYVRDGIQVRYDYRSDQFDYYEMTEDPDDSRSIPGDDPETANYRKTFLTTVGADSGIRNLPGDVVTLGKELRRNLGGLGYVQ